MPKRVEDVRLRIERVRVAFPAKSSRSISLLEESLGRRGGEEGAEELVEVGVRS